MGNHHGHGRPLQSIASDPLEDITNTIKVPKQNVVNNSKRILLMGSGDGAKSTFFKQTRIIFHNGFSVDDRAYYLPIIRMNILSGMKILCDRVISLQTPLEQKLETTMNDIMRLEAYYNNDELEAVWTDELVAKIKFLWNQPIIQEQYKAKSEFQMLYSMEYFIDNINKYTTNYIAVDEDVLRSRVKTTGIVECEYEVNRHKLVFIDVGGQRNERRKWFHCFEGISTVIFCVSLSEYDETCYEDETTNRSLESQDCFNTYINGVHFPKNVPCVLFLSHVDLFADKIRQGVPLKQGFPTYNKDHLRSVPAALQHIRHTFEKLSTSGREVYTVVANTIEAMRQVFSRVEKIIFTGRDDHFKFEHDYGYELSLAIIRNSFTDLTIIGTCSL